MVRLPWIKPVPPPLTGRRARVWAKTGGRCAYCGERLLTRSSHPRSFHVDHVVPKAHGGTGDLSNLAPTCRVCNLRKGARDLEAFRVAEERRLRREPGPLARRLGRRHRFWFEKRGL